MDRVNNFAGLKRQQVMNSPIPSRGGLAVIWNARANERDKLERLCRYIARPALSSKRLSMTRNGRVRYELKTPYRNGTTHVLFEPLDFMYRMYGMPRAQEAQERPSPGWSPSTAGMQEVEPCREQLPRRPGRDQKNTCPSGSEYFLAAGHLLA